MKSMITSKLRNNQFKTYRNKSTKLLKLALTNTT